MKKIWSFFLVSLFVLSTILFSCQAKTDEKIIAKVNNKALTENQIEEFIPLEFRGSVTLEQKRSIVQKWIENELLYQEAKRRKIDQDKDIQNRINNAIKDIVVMEFLDKEFGGKIQATQEEAKNFYRENKDSFRRGEDEVRASHILLKTQEEADSVWKKLAKGADFVTSVQQFSVDSITLSRGGDLGYFTKSTMILPIAEVAFKLKIGELSSPIKTDFGYHIVKVTDKKERKTIRDFDSVKDQILDYLTNEKRAQKVRELVEQLRVQAKIERLDWVIEGTPAGE